MRAFKQEKGRTLKEHKIEEILEAGEGAIKHGFSEQDQNGGKVRKQYIQDKQIEEAY